MTTGLTKTEKILLAGMEHFGMSKEDMKMIVFFLEEDDKLLLVHYMKTHSNATPQDILTETARLLKQRKKLMS